MSKQATKTRGILFVLCAVLMVVSVSANAADFSADFHEDFNGGYTAAFNMTGWSGWCVSSWTNPVEDTTHTPWFRYYHNGTTGNYPGYGRGSMVKDETYAATGTEITLKYSTDTYETAAIIFNYQDKNNFYVFGVGASSSSNNSVAANAAKFLKIVNGTVSTVATFSNPAWGTYGAYADGTSGPEISVGVNGSNFTFTINRADQTAVSYSATDSSFTNGGQAGLILNSNWTHTVADDFKVIIPEPASASILLLGAVALLRRRKK